VTIAVRDGYRHDVPSRNAPRDLRASDADRERVIALLGEAVSDGRLTPDEHAQRLEAAISARTLGELAGLTTDLVTSDAQPLRLDGTRPVAAVFGPQRREGRWVVPERMAVAAVFGEALLDFREALLQSPRIVIYATVFFGRLKILIPEGITVEVTAASVASSSRGPVTRRPPEVGGSQTDPGRATSAAGPAAAPSSRVAAPASPVAAPTSRTTAPGPPELPVIEVRGLIVAGRVQAVAPPRARFFGIFPRRSR
jgi:uncharacterized protein DUF1707/cell wall-active antibiotic response 4TMS protein YvqF